MRTYEIRLIEHEVALDYYGAEGKLLHLFQEARQAQGTFKTIVDQQIQYISKSFDPNEIYHKLAISAKFSKGFPFQEGSYGRYIEVRKGKSEARLYIKNDYMLLQGKGNLSAEMLVFDWLREIDQTFLAIDYERERLGWLTIIRPISLTQ
ncbi:sporulation inhibitor of replication protein SirA [Texcoconibacillus texcoconensis]|uniref:Sporulation inhibitor of replication protein SirA n=1 Tax=Texcoconibacillus texcoconensis TaxID=1095777 RepID=A0A840QT40_9BACI|nr:sporulation inhibitor of replication protein SirA [Texcoconibacillus texcoconensis]MBB5174437.1 hypothetical protein [Texcoconibacillus texcoconensis]